MDYLVLTKVHGAILGPISQILGWILNVLVTFTNSFGVLNIGLSIILFTLVVKLLMFPMTIKQQKASKLMAVMQPELQAIQAKYKGSMSIRIVLFRHWIVSHRCGGNTAYIKQIFCCAIMDLRRMSYYHPAALILIRIWILNVIGRWDIWSYFR